MRVHPSNIAPSWNKWQKPAAAALVFILLLSLAFRRPEPLVNTPVAISTEKKVQVVIAGEAIAAGQPFERVKLVIQERPENTLPADRITSIEMLKNKVAAGPIPSGNPLSGAFLADPVTVLQVENEIPEVARMDPTDALLQGIEADTVAVPISFPSAAPNRGSRIAVTLSRSRGDSLLLVEECWVSKSSGREAVLRVDPSKAMLIQTARNFGNFGFIELPTAGQNPYAGKGITTEDDLQALLDENNPAKARTPALPSVTKDKRLKGYAWVTGEQVRYGIDEDGQIKVVDPK